MVRMYHDNPAKTGGPTTADVPAAAVSWMQACGWYLKPSSASPETAETKSERASVARKSKKSVQADEDL